MVFFNYATMQMAAKIVYYGPGLCGKTTNLHHIYTRTSPQSRGEMVSLETETDRTLFFDLLPIDVGVIGGFKTRLQLYTVPGQVFYNTTRKLVLKGVDGIVFVADSQWAMLDANIESFKNLRDNLNEIGLNLDDLPVVVQLNKRDLPNVADPKTIVAALDAERKYDLVESIASNGAGVFETLKLISKLTLRTLRRRMTGDEPVKIAPRRVADVASFRVKEDAGASPARTISGTKPLSHPPVTAPPPATPSFTTPIASARGSTSAQTKTQPLRVVRVEEPEEPEAVEAIEASDEPFSESTLAKTGEVGIGMMADAPLAPQAAAPQPVEEPLAEKPETITIAAEAPAAEAPPSLDASESAARAPEPEVDFSQTEKSVKAPLDMKRVKVRSSIDIMAELEALRKRATQATPKAKKETPAPEPAVPVTKPKRDMHHTVVMQANPSTVPDAKSVKVTVSFERDGEVLEQHEQTVELVDVAEVRSLSLDVKIALE